MRRFIITGAPGSGKTAIIRQLELDRFSVVEEAATDVIATTCSGVEPWRELLFIDAISSVCKKERQPARPISRMMFSFTTAVPCAPRRSLSPAILIHPFLPANWSA